MSVRDRQSPVLLIRSQKLHDSNFCVRQILHVKLSDTERLRVTIEETVTSLEDVSGWFRTPQVSR